MFLHVYNAFEHLFLLCVYDKVPQTGDVTAEQTAALAAVAAAAAAAALAASDVKEPQM